MPRPLYQINNERLVIDHIRKLLHEGARLELSDDTSQGVVQCSDFLDQKLSEENAVYYGINTGFGSLCNERISSDEINTLQYNLVQSHACGTGPEVPAEIVRTMLLLKIKNLSFGFSAIQLSTLQKLITLFNEDILPVIYEQGSLGASGDLAPLAHLALPLLCKGMVRINDEKKEAFEVALIADWGNQALVAKEGLAMLNGTQFSTAYAVNALIKSNRLWQQANMIAALSIDAFNCKMEPFSPQLHQLRGQRGQIEAARSIREWLMESELTQQPNKAVQDPYSFRCVPQVHGASWQAIQHANEVVEAEINAVTDNPTLFPDEDLILSGGNFHAQPIALVSDYLAIALSELGSISERRTYQLISGQRGLPDFLIARPGLNSGLMIPQYTAASIVSQNKQLCTPASVDSIVSSNGQEDHVSMAANAGTKLYRVVENVERILAIEWMTAAQAMDCRKEIKTSPALESIHASYRKQVPYLEEDRILSKDIETTIRFLRTLELNEK